MTTLKKTHSKQYTNANSRNKIFIGGLAGDINERDLMNYFEQYSKIEDCVVMIDKITNHSRGFGFITIENESKVDAILNNQPHIIKGKKVECKKAIPKEVIQNHNDQLTEEILRRKQSNDILFYSRKLFVGGLPLSLTEEEMIRYFSQYGEIESCLIKKEEETGKSRGFGFILFVNKESINNVLTYGQNHYILGKWIECKQAHPKEFQESQNNANINSNNRYSPYQNNFIPQQKNMLNYYLNQNNKANPNPDLNLNTNRSNDSQMKQIRNTINQMNLNDNKTMANATNNNNSSNSYTVNSNQIDQTSFINQMKLFQYQQHLITNNTFSSLNRRNDGSGNIYNININQSFHIQSQANDCMNTLDEKTNNNNNLNTINSHSNLNTIPNQITNQSEQNTTQDINQRKFYNPMINSTIPETNQGYIPNREIDTISYYFNNCIRNPECNSYINYKLFDSSGEEVSKLAYKNSGKMQLFTEDNDKDYNVSEVPQSSTQIHPIDSQISTQTFPDHNHWKQSRNFRLKTDRYNIDNLNGLYKPY